MSRKKFSVENFGKFDRTERILTLSVKNPGGKFFKKLLAGKLDKYGRIGVERLSDATPKDTGLTASSWSYSIRETDTGIEISWNNSNLSEDWANVAMLIQYGHGTRSGVYIEGIDYINPALKPIFEKLGVEAWEEVKNHA